MYKGKTFLAVIPARGGSKRLPGKNLLNLSGKPLIAWTIEPALKSKYIDSVVVSTDNINIANIAKKYGANIPCMRPDILSKDKSKTIDAVLHVLDCLDNIDDHYDYMILLQPTSPLRTLKNIDNSIEVLINKNASAVISVCESRHSPLWCNRISSNGDMSKFFNANMLKRSQDLKKYVCLNGAIYICSINKLKEEKTFFLSSSCLSYEMTLEESIDIDTKFDFLHASAILNSM
jgi:CMP-N,N'-diacetyllegionaminic acid synthase